MAGTTMFAYRLPNWAPFFIAILGMAIVTDLAIATGPSTSDWDRDVLGNGTAIPAHWTFLTNLSGGAINVEAFMRFCYHLWADHTNGTSVVSFYIAVGAHMTHAIEAFFAMKKCQQYGATAAVTLMYGVGVFISGVGQFGPLKAEARRIDGLKVDEIGKKRK